MSIMSDFFDSFSSIAMEADDITGVADEAEKAIGDSSSSPTPSTDNKEISLNTDNLLADDNETKDQKEEGDDVPDGNESGEEENQNTDEEQSTEDEEDEFTDPDEGLMDDDVGEENDFEKTRKKKLWELYRTFYKNLDNALKLMNKYVPKEIKPEVIHMLTNIKNNLTDTKETVYKILTDKYQKMDCAELLKNFIGLNHIYDLTIKQLENYFGQMISDKKK